MARVNNARNVSFGKPKLGGVAYCAPIGTPLPKGPDDQLDPAFVNVGFLSEDGITLTTDSDNATIVEMGGLTVLTVVSSSSETYQFVMLEQCVEAARARFGSQNVTVDDMGNIRILHNGLPTEALEWVFEILLTGDRKDRHVVPNATISEVGDITYNSTDAKGWDITLAANSDSRIDSATSVEYIAALVDSVTLVVDGTSDTPSGDMKIGDSQTLAVNAIVNGEPIKVTNGVTVTSSTDAVTVNGTTITAAQEGTALITVTAGGQTLTLNVTVTPKA